MADQDTIAAARAKLAAKFESRIGGKGTQRRKVKAKHQSNVVADDKKLGQNLKKLGVNQIPGIEEVNMFTDDEKVIHFSDPKVQASLQANTYVVTGQSETKPVASMMPQILQQMGMSGMNSHENIMQLKKLLESMPQAAGAGAGDLDIPEVAANFEDVSNEAAQDVEVD